MFGGSGIDFYTVVRGLGGSADVIGFKATDHITLTGGFTAADASSAVTSATHSALGTSMTLSDGTKLTLFGVSVDASQVTAT